jgi:hypothetical protein
VRPLFTSARVAQNKLLDGYSTEQLKVLADFFQRSRTMFEEERQGVLDSIKPVKKSK